MAKQNEFSNLWDVAEVMEVTGAFKGKSFSITGHLGRPRDAIVKIIEQAGGVFHKTPEWGTTYLITNREWNAGSTVREGTSRKLLKAQRNGTKIISEKQFCEMLIAAGETAADGTVG